MNGKTSYFGLPIVDGKLVRETDIQRLPFANFWQESAVGSATLQNGNGGENFVYLHDWERFAELFIRTGRHRFMAVDSEQKAGSISQTD